MEHGLELIIPRLEIFGNLIFNMFSYPGNIGNRSFSDCLVSWKYWKLDFSSCLVSWKCWRLDFSSFLVAWKYWKTVFF